MFSAEPWARAFAGAFPPGETADADAAVEAFRAYCAAVLSVPGDLSGVNGASRIAAFVDAALEKTGLAKNAAAAYARKFFLLVVRKGCFHEYRNIAARIQQLLNEQKGLADAILEAPFEPDAAFLDMVKRRLAGITGANEVRLGVRMVPDLIGGVRIRLGSVLFDGSVKTALTRMTADLSSPQEVS